MFGGKDCDDAFRTLKKLLTTSPVEKPSGQILGLIVMSH
jgi:hypothetical protein